MAEPLILVQRYRIDPAVYRTDIPLIVAERCRNAGAYEDGIRPETPPLITTWYALRWLMAAYPHHKGFNQRAICQVAGYDQKSSHKRLRKLYDLGLIIEVGRESYPNLKGGDDKAKSRPIYSIPIDELDRLSSTLASSILVLWEHRLFGGSSQLTMQVDSQLAFDLSDPLQDQTPRDSWASDPLRDQASDPLQDQSEVSDPLQDQTPDPLQDQTSDPVADHGGREGEREGMDALIALPENTETVIPAAPAGETSLQMHPLELWRRLSTQQREIDSLLLRQLAAEHNTPSGGYGWYWVGRAIMTTAMGPEPSDWWAKLRATMHRWRNTDSYGSDVPTSARRPRPSPAVVSPAPPPAGDKPSDLPILLAKGITGRERADILAKFRRAAAAGDIAKQQRILNDLAERTTDDPTRTL